VAYLLDTNVLSELRKNSPDPSVAKWIKNNSRADFYVSALVIGELRNGIERIRVRDAAQSRFLEVWLDGVREHYGDRILPVTANIAELWGRLNVPPTPPPIVDGLIVATALTHGLTLVTRNVADVVRTGVALVNPFDAG
jgi:predicted nucleic acid-binding protein